jgi:hypothetical protein
MGHFSVPPIIYEYTNWQMKGANKSFLGGRGVGGLNVTILYLHTSRK